MKKLLFLMMAILMLPIALAIDECQRTNKDTNIPCYVISSWNPGDCEDYNVSIYNQSGVIIVNTSWANYTPVCYFNFSVTLPGVYNYNSSVENGVVTVVGDEQMIFLIFVPLALCFLFIFWAGSLQESQDALKWFMRLLSLVMIFATFGAANIIIAKNPSYSGLQAVFDFTIVQAIFYTIVGVVLIYLLIKLFMSFRNMRRKDFEDGVIK